MNKAVLAFLLLLLIVVLYLALCTIQTKQMGLWQGIVIMQSSGSIPPSMDSYTTYQQYGMSFVGVLMLLSKFRFWIPFLQTPRLGA